jgi:hypothetical protein
MMEVTRLAHLKSSFATILISNSGGDEVSKRLDVPSLLYWIADSHKLFLCP